MGTAFPDALRAWHDFFLLTGGAAATLVGLVFVAISLAGAETRRTARHTGDTFVSPIVTDFGVVLVISALGLVPDHTAGSLAAAVSVLGVAGLSSVTWIFYRLVEHHRVTAVDGEHWRWHLGMPFLAASLLMGAGLSLQYGVPRALDVLAAAIALRLVVAMRNAWKLAVWLITRE
jgi:hypothetical protein